MTNIFEFISHAISSKEFLLCVELFSFCCKLYLFIALASYSFKSSSTKFLSLLLIVFLSGTLLCDSAWVIKILRDIMKIQTKSKAFAFYARIGWALFLTQHQTLSLFLTYFIEKKIVFKKYNIFLSCLNAIISCCFLHLAFFKYHIPSDSPLTLSYERNLIQASCLVVFPILLPAVYITLKKIISEKLPKILAHQLKIFIVYLILPHLFLELITNESFFLSFICKALPLNRNTLLSISTILSSYAIYYCSRSIMNLRFLNIRNQVESQKKFNFINDFKEILEQLSFVTSLKELAHITQIFFKAAFEIPVGRTRIYIRNLNEETNNLPFNDTLNITNKVENFLLQHNNQDFNIGNILQQSKILIHDEIEFSNFYDETKHRSEIINFLNSINADIFLPIYERQTITAYIIVERDARPEQLYTNSERDEMLVFTSYLSNIINILQHSNLEALLRKEKEIEEELYLKHQEINQYKESIRSFLRTNKESKIGIIFYKNRKFIFANQAAKDLIAIDINANEGHQITQALRKIVKYVEEYKTLQTSFIKDENGNRLVLSSIPSLEQNSVITLIYQPEPTDIIKIHLDLLKDPSNWDYLLYLETTQSGHLINQLIPGSGETLINFKINLLATALSRKAILLDMPEDDLQSTVEILHNISLRQTLHTIKLTVAEKNNEISIKLFGISPLIESENVESILEKLNNVGTLFIQNIHLLSLETQNSLAEFINCGFFYKYGSDHKIFSDVRIICSSPKNLQNMVTNGQFSKNLFNKLKSTSLCMPSLATLPEPEIVDLADGFTEQLIKSSTFKKIMNLSEKDKSKILTDKPISLKDLKERVQQLLINKSTKHEIYNEIEFNPAYNISDPEIAIAVKLGKKALKDPKIIAALWDKFKNQNKIANLLGVNRSSINRRLQQYNIK